MDRHAVTHHVQVRTPEIHYFLATRVLDEGITDIPFAWNYPIEDGSTARHLLQIKRDMRTDFSQGFPDAVSGNAAADRKYFCGEIVHVITDIRRDKLFGDFGSHIHHVSEQAS